MQTLTIRADEALISQIVAISKALANTTNQKLIIDDGYADELNARADEALNDKPRRAKSADYAMVIEYKPKFERELKIIFDFIAKDSLSRAREFRNELIAKIERTAQTPFICRKSINFNDESIRDLIFKSYVIPYLIDDEVIYVLGIYKANEWQAS